MRKKSNWCWNWCSPSKRFPTLAVLFLIIGVLWLLDEIGTISFNIPWIPVIIIVLSAGAIIDHFMK